MEKICKMLKRNNKGFTLVELMVVLLIIGILVAIAVPIYNKTQENARETTCKANIRTIEGAVAQFAAEEGKTIDEVDADGTSVNTVYDVLGDYLKEQPECPGKGTYSIINGEVYCSIHKKAPEPETP